MSLLTPFFLVPAIVILIGIFYNTCWLYRRCSQTRYAHKANSIAVVFAILSLSMPMLVFVGLPAALKLFVGMFCLGNFLSGVVHIVRWFAGPRKAAGKAQNAKNAGDKRD